MTASAGARIIASYLNSDRTGTLDLTGCTGLTALPDGLTVGGSLYLGRCTGLTALPDGLTVGGTLYLTGCTGLTALPDGLTVGGSLDLTGCTGLTALPDGLTVGGTLYLDGCTGLTALYQAGKDSRGYAFIGVPVGTVMHVEAGCRFFTLAHAVEHWRDNPECLALVHKIAAHAEQVAA